MKNEPSLSQSRQSAKPFLVDASVQSVCEAKRGKGLFLFLMPFARGIRWGGFLPGWGGEGLRDFRWLLFLPLSGFGGFFWEWGGGWLAGRSVRQRSSRAEWRLSPAQSRWGNACRCAGCGRCAGRAVPRCFAAARPTPGSFWSLRSHCSFPPFAFHCLRPGFGVIAACPLRMCPHLLRVIHAAISNANLERAGPVVDFSSGVSR